jgi:hypothetical protein
MSLYAQQMIRPFSFLQLENFTVEQLKSMCQTLCCPRKNRKEDVVVVLVKRIAEELKSNQQKK